MHQPFALNSLKSNEKALIRSISIEGEMHDRLRDFGFCEGARITYLFSAAFGDPRAYLVRDTVIALRNSDAAQIECVLEGGK